MLTNKHECYTILNELNNNGVDVADALNEVVCGITPKVVVDELIKRDDDVVNFYLNLNKKAHKIIKEILTCDGKTVGTYIKIATSLITQSVITAEHLYQNDIEGQNHFMECIGTARLAEALSYYFQTGDFSKLIETVEVNKQDVKSILDD